MIVVFGDSYTSGTGAAAGEAFPDHLGRLLGEQVLGRGVHGSTARESIGRLQGDVLDAEPELAILEFGVNEAFRGHPVQACIDGLRPMVQACRAADIDVALVGVHFAHFQADFDAALGRLAGQHACGLVTGALDGVLEDHGLRSDRFHPNGAGYRIMAERVAPEVRRLLHRSRTLRTGTPA